MELTNKELKRLENGREYRNMTMQVRASDEGDMTVEGYATTFNEPYTLYDSKYYTVREQVSPDAFTDCDMSDVILQYNHEGRVFARNKNGTLKLEVDSKGLKVTADLSGTEIGHQLYEEIKGGYTDKMSFGFIVAEDERVYTDQPGDDHEDCLRTITKISKLFDVSAVSIPANDMTSISARQLTDGVIEKLEAERLNRANMRKRINLKLLGV